MSMDRNAAWALLTEYTKSDSLLKHAMGVEAAVRGYARKFGANEDEWGVVALLHDFDYERWPSADDHPFRGCEILKERGYPEWVTRAILSHAPSNARTCGKAPRSSACRSTSTSATSSPSCESARTRWDSEERCDRRARISDCSWLTSIRSSRSTTSWSSTARTAR